VSAGNNDSAEARGEAALRQAAAALGVPADVVLCAALLRAAAEAVTSDAAFAARVRAALAGSAENAERSVSAAARVSAASHGTPAAPRLVPIARVEHAVLDPFGPPDPLYLYRLYGEAQLPTALTQYSYASLKEAAALLPPDPAGGPLRGRRSKDELIAAIVARVTALARAE
jgi:hypothetical protein